MEIGCRAYTGTRQRRRDNGNRRSSREALPRVVFVLDRNNRNYPNAEQFELAVSVAASLLELTIARGMPIGFVSAGKTECWYGEGRAPVSKDEVFGHLVDVEADGSEPIGQLLCQVAERYEPGVHIVVIGAAADEQLSAAMSALEGKRMVPSIIHIGHKRMSDEAAAKVRNWQSLCQSKQWEFISVDELDKLPLALGVYRLETAIAVGTVLETARAGAVSPSFGPYHRHSADSSFLRLLVGGNLLDYLRHAGRYGGYGIAVYSTVVG